MEECVFEDALAGSTITFDAAGRAAVRVCDAAGEAANGRAAASAGVPSLFFPGCSFINYALPLVQAVYGTLRDGGRVDGISLLCCGKILSFEPDGKAVRAAFEDDLCAHIAAAGVQRIVAACPNCVKALRDALASHEGCEGVEVVALPGELAAMGYRIDAEVAQRMIAAAREAAGAADADGGRALRVCVHDSCPDRDTGAFADGTRALLPDGLLVEAAHTRHRSFCCGSLLRAAGKYDAADKQARRHGEEAVDAGADAIVTACMSCAFQLSRTQSAVPVLHYLELLYDWRIDWAAAPPYMGLRFLFEEAQGERRTFAGAAAAPAEEGER